MMRQSGAERIFRLDDTTSPDPLAELARIVESPRPRENHRVPVIATNADDPFVPIQEFFRGNACFVPNICTSQPPRRAREIGLVQVTTQRRTIGPAEEDELMRQCRAQSKGWRFWQYRGNRVHALTAVYNADGTTTFMGTACCVRN